MAQPGRPNKPDALWYTLESILALNLPAQYLVPMRDALRREIKMRFQAMSLDAYQEPGSITPERVMELLRDHFYGWPPPGS